MCIRGCVQAANYFERGDWHDTLRMPTRGMGGPLVRARFQTDRFTGIVPLHCHYLVHEDQGMLATVQVNGVEGRRSEWAQAEEHLGRCVAAPAARATGAAATSSLAALHATATPRPHSSSVLAAACVISLLVSVLSKAALRRASSSMTHRHRSLV